MIVSRQAGGPTITGAIRRLSVFSLSRYDARTLALDEVLVPSAVRR